MAFAIFLSFLFLNQSSIVSLKRTWNIDGGEQLCVLQSQSLQQHLGNGEEKEVQDYWKQCSIFWIVHQWGWNQVLQYFLPVVQRCGLQPMVMWFLDEASSSMKLEMESFWSPLQFPWPHPRFANSSQNGNAFQQELHGLPWWVPRKLGEREREAELIHFFWDLKW